MLIRSRVPYLMSSVAMPKAAYAQMNMFGDWMGGTTKTTTTTDTSGAQTTDKTAATGENKTNGAGDGKNNDSVDDDIIASIWDEPKPAEKKVEAAVTTTTQNQTTPEQQVSKFLTDNGLGDFTPSEAQKAEMAAGNFEGVLKEIGKRSQTAFIKSMQHMNTLVEQKVKDAVTKAVGDSKSYVEGKELRSLMHTTLPFTKDPAISPVAETVLQRFLQKPGTTREAAIANVKKYFEKTAELVGGSVNKTTGGTFKGNNRGPVEDTDWLAALTGKSS